MADIDVLKEKYAALGKTVNEQNIKAVSTMSTMALFLDSGRFNRLMCECERLFAEQAVEDRRAKR